MCGVKLSKRKRYVLKWNGPHFLADYKRQRRSCRSKMGFGDQDERFIATAYLCRCRGFYPSTPTELFRMAGEGGAW